MLNYQFPKSFRFSTLEERNHFYEYEFQYEAAINWLNRFNGYELSLSLDLGVETGITQKGYENQPKFIRVGSVKPHQLQSLLLTYLPEDLYYDRYFYDNINHCHTCDQRRAGKCLSCEHCEGQELLFDVDPENYHCPKCDADQDNRIFSFCHDCFNATKLGVKRLYDYLSGRFRGLSIVYSGRGYHIHVFDEKAFYLSGSQRHELVQGAKKIGVGVDGHVTTGEIYLVRMPYSLNGLVSRIALPVDIDGLDSFNPFLFDAVPKFLNLSK